MLFLLDEIELIWVVVRVVETTVWVIWVERVDMLEE